MEKLRCPVEGGTLAKVLGDYFPYSKNAIPIKENPHDQTNTYSSIKDNEAIGWNLYGQNRKKQYIENSVKKLKYLAGELGLDCLKNKIGQGTLLTASSAQFLLTIVEDSRWLKVYTHNYRDKYKKPNGKKVICYKNGLDNQTILEIDAGFYELMLELGYEDYQIKKSLRTFRKCTNFYEIFRRKRCEECAKVIEEILQVVDYGNADMSLVMQDIKLELARYIQTDLTAAGNSYRILAQKMENERQRINDAIESYTDSPSNFSELRTNDETLDCYARALEQLLHDSFPSYTLLMNAYNHKRFEDSTDDAVRDALDIAAATLRNYLYDPVNVSDSIKREYRNLYYILSDWAHYIHSISTQKISSHDLLNSFRKSDYICAEVDSHIMQLKELQLYFTPTQIDQLRELSEALSANRQTTDTI